MNPQLIRAMDLNHDTVIDADEMAKAATSLKTLDKNGDGKLTTDEYRPGGGAGRPGGGGPRENARPAPEAEGSPKPAPPDAMIPPSSAPSAQAPAGAPNVLLIIADDLGWGDVAFHHGPAATPHLDRFVKEGVELQRFYTYPVCSPTRAALLSGQMPRRFGVTNVMGPQDKLPGDLVTMPGVFRSAGYTTSLVGKWHLGAGGPQEHGFDHFYGFAGGEIDYSKHTNPRGTVDWQRDGTTLNEEGYSTYLIADEAIRQINARDAKRPFLIQVAFKAPHVPQSAPDELVAKYQSLGERATAAAVVEAMDTSIGRILTALSDAKLSENTIVIFFSDNGATRRNGSNGSLRAGKGTLYDGGIHTPCAVRWPGKLPAGTTNLTPVATQDLFPTLAAAAGVKVTAKLDGISLWPSLHEGRVATRPPFAVATSDIAVIDGEWKLIETAGAKRELYHVTADASESSDEFPKQPEVAARLGATLDSLKSTLPAAIAGESRPRGGRFQGGRQTSPR
jgi:arylsulfatase A-like enzyme